ncbi:PepSY domain-containing protein [Acinetobacter sp. WU_MDCI_Axc73]|nr:PepSY domain-containing protein [Acinetobacter sp. WU_MDCI_Axc73]
MAAPQSSATFWRDFFILLHRYAGIFIAPFIFVAAFTGLLYVLTPQLEQWTYRDMLLSDEQSHIHPLNEQVQAAQRFIPPTAQITAVRPAPTSHDTTRVIYSDAQQQIRNRAIFVDPHNLKIKGQLDMYGTSGILPLRTFLDRLHRDLLLGEWGRVYSELAASWMGLLALSGVYHWLTRRKQLNQSERKKSHLVKWHSWIGLALLPLLLFFSITGLTWSNWAGANILTMRQWFAWQTPNLMTSLSGQTTVKTDLHQEHHAGMNMQMHRMYSAQDFATALQLARHHGIDAAKVQIRPPSGMDQAWTVEEIDRRWPTQVDSIAVDIIHHKVVDHLYFEQFPLAAKLTRWGVDAHMGILFGWPNQVLLILFTLGLCVSIVLAYRAWWQTADFKKTTLDFSRRSLMMWRTGTSLQRIGLVLILLISGICLPIFGVSLLFAVCWVMLNRTQH